MSDSDDGLMLPGMGPTKSATSQQAPQVASKSAADDDNYASNLLSARRAGLRSGAPKRDPFAPVRAGASSGAVSPTTSNAPKPAPVPTPQAQSRPAANSPTSSPPSKKTSPRASSPLVTPPAAAPQPMVVPPSVTMEDLDKLRKKLQARKEYLATLQEQEKDLLEQQRRSAAEAASSITKMDMDIKQAWAEVEEERAKYDREIRDAEEEQERFLRDERRRIDEEVAAQMDPEIKTLQEELAALREERAKLQHTLSMSAVNGDVVNSAINSAINQIISRVESQYEKKMKKDEEWEAHMREIVRKEVRASFAPAIDSEAQAEREEYAKAFEETIKFWEACEEESRQYIAKIDEQMIQDLKSTAMDDMKRVQGEEQRIQEVYAEVRDAWAQFHRSTLNEELEALVQRRTAEFEEIRKAKQEIHVEELQQLDRLHKYALEQKKKLHEQELACLRDQFSQRELLNAERSKMLLSVQEDAARASRTISETVNHVSKTLQKLEQYRASIEEGKAILDAERKKNLELRESTLSEVQTMIVSQANAVESERAALATALVKLQVVERTVDAQMEEDKSWVAQMSAKLDRSKGEWEREYARWRKLAQQEKIDAEQRFNEVLMDLRSTAASLEQHGQELDIEASALRRHCTDRAARQAAEGQELRRKRDELAGRHEAMVKAIEEMEKKGRRLSEQWKELHEERRALAAERERLREDEIRMQAMSEQLKFMGSHFDTVAHEMYRNQARHQAMSNQLSAAREVVGADMREVQDQGARLAKEKENLLREQDRVLGNGAPAQKRDVGFEGSAGATSLAPSDGRHMTTATSAHHDASKHHHDRKVALRDPNRLPMQVLGELRQTLARSLAGGLDGNPVLASANAASRRGDMSASYRPLPHETQPSPTSHASYFTARTGREQTSTSSSALMDSPISRRDNDTRYTAAGTTFHDPSSAHFTRLMAMSDFETTSASQEGRDDYF